MKRIRWKISAGAVLLFALVYFFDDTGIVSAAVPAVLAHEAGHLIPLLLFRHPPRRVSVGVFGLEIDYAGHLEGGQALLCIGGGPAFGLLCAVAVCSFGGAFWRMSGAAGFLLSAFNLLPILPLDGGRLVSAAVNETFAMHLSRIFALLFAVCGMAAALRFHTFSLLLTGAWLVVCNYRR